MVLICFLLLLLIIETKWRPRLGQSNHYILLWYGDSWHKRKYRVLFKK